MDARKLRTSAEKSNKTVGMHNARDIARLWSIGHKVAVVVMVISIFLPSRFKVRNHVTLLFIFFLTRNTFNFEALSSTTTASFFFLFHFSYNK
jgi:hypothetical protein